uniref:Uncharacterized protein n=1 Tax=Steinernema glaseri TaxID=37863 RepID=A0A1I7Y2E3_9BILA
MAARSHRPPCGCLLHPYSVCAPEPRLSFNEYSNHVSNMLYTNGNIYWQKVEEKSPNTQKHDECDEEHRRMNEEEEEGSGPHHDSHHDLVMSFINDVRKCEES